jgi:hypothetical protein
LAVIEPVPELLLLLLLSLLEQDVKIVVAARSASARIFFI